MAVILPNTTLTLRRKQHQYEEDAHGFPVAGETWGAPVGPYPGALVIPSDGPTSSAPWAIRADIRLDPILPNDELTVADGRVFLVVTARPTRVPGYDYVDYVAVTAELTPPYVP